MAASNKVGSTYESQPLAVLPSVVLRAGVVGVVYAAFTWIFLRVVYGPGRQSVPGWVIDLDALSPPVIYGILGTAFLLPFLLTVTVAVVGYRNRRYVIGPDGIREYRWVLAPRQCTLRWPEVEDVTFTQSRLQSLYGTGTIRINNVDTSTVGKEEEMRIRYVENPESVYSEIRSAIGQSTSADRQLELPESVRRSGTISSLSADRLAADASSTYHVPAAIVHPNPAVAARYGLVYGTIASAFLFPFLLVFAFVIQLTVGIFSVASGLVFVLGCAASVVLLVAGTYYFRYDGQQYELYGDHLVASTRGWKTTVRYDDVVRLSGPDVGWTQLKTARKKQAGSSTTLLLVLEILLGLGSETGSFALLDGEGEILVQFEFLDDADELRTVFESLVG